MPEDRSAAPTARSGSGRRRAGAPTGQRRSSGARARGRMPLSSDALAARRAARAGLVPAISYPEHLPVVERRDDIAAAIRDHQVVVIAGETGSGKTTQIPKICLELGRGLDGLIGHTQPRRIAARAVAERLSEELEVELGSTIGYQVRFTDQSTRHTLVKVMTDGILLAELQRDRELRRYDTIIIDEAHERSLNIDFILGYLKQLLPRRPDLKVIITSATIDPERFARHFAASDGTPAPVIEVSGRTYPVEVRYRPLIDPDRPDDDERDMITGICEAVEELWTERHAGPSSDILVFLSGEREIRDAADALNGLQLPVTEVVPLYARLSAAEQHRVFQPHTGRRIILATNVAETSLTVPGIRYVIDTGTARISRYSQRTKVQRLPIEPVSQASANQRSGRCGRVSEGIAIRLYSEDDYRSRPEFTDPEILRTNLASVILQMTSLGLGDIARFPFLDPPDSRQITDGIRLLEELQAFAPEEETQPTPKGRRRPGRRLTAYGRTIATLPIDPRHARMVIEADRRGVLREVLVIVAALSIQDPRERPQDKQELANAAHKRFADESSDFLSWLKLWAHLKEQQRALSSSAFRRMCKAEFLHYLRVREWQDLHAQLKQAAKQVGLDVTRGRVRTGEGEVDADAVHQSLLAGLLSHVGVRDEQRREYLGARGARFGISPGSALFRKQPQFVMAEELVETTRLWARMNARIDPVWAEELGDHMVKRQYSEPRWSGRRGSAVATERVTLYGVPLVVGRTTGLSKVDPELARDLFIRHALVEGDWPSEHRFLRENAALLERVGELEARARRRDISVDDSVLVAFYDQRVPGDVVSGRHFDTWWKRARRETPDLLTFTEDLLLRGGSTHLEVEDHPTTWRQGELELEVTYQFDPGSELDGATVHVPVERLNQVRADGFDWQVRGFREELVTALIRSLPKTTRRHLVPTPDHARAVLPELDPAEGRLVDALAAALRRRAGVAVSPDDFDWDRVPGHLRVTFSVDAPDGERVAVGKDLEAVRESATPQLRRRVRAASAGIERRGLTSWDLDRVPETFESAAGIQGYPALVDTGAAVDLRVLPTRAEADAEHRLGVRRLLLLGISPPWKQILARLTNVQKLALGHNPHGSVPALLADCLAAAVDSISAEVVAGGARPAGPVPAGSRPSSPGGIRTREDFEWALSAVRTHTSARVVQVVGLVEPVLARHLSITNRLAELDRSSSPAIRPMLADVRAQVSELIRPGFVAATGLGRLRDLDRYLRAVEHRLDKGPADPARDAQALDQVDLVEGRYADLLEALRPSQQESAEVLEVAWMIEELRVSLFAQALGTAYSVSPQRVLKAIARLAP
ncbi:ATP-dependent RNA helicase HrpA [Intrasporangium calvum]|uniref:RNA helicase n=1 Tax=Intrasporangium calvum (strain ATCC 23552 / DSM 43043 / JCM 3097 / NBRC 12989 / NCIMB 10167 / NRRL B-3866 / 7 KIP) TaxID=710696 RepID=E6S890_INTC7|nr:ATP-dependent helicase HrpA [Intrasporangium calvum DSM 43043]